MGILELIFIALGLSMDAFAVAVGNGMAYKNNRFYWTILIALTFGVFQGIMPVIGYALGAAFSAYIVKFDHIIALALLGFIGGKMLYDALSKKQATINKIKRLTLGVLLIQGIATSIDALAVGVSFSAFQVNIVMSAGIIAITTFICSFAGVIIGKKFGSILNKKAEIAGGIILIAIGIKIFVEHTFFPA